MVNHNSSLLRSATLHFKGIPGLDCTDCHVTDVWQQKDMGVMSHSFKADIPSHASVFLALRGSNASCLDAFAPGRRVEDVPTR